MNVIKILFLQFCIYLTLNGILSKQSRIQHPYPINTRTQSSIFKTASIITTSSSLLLFPSCCRAFQFSFDDNLKTARDSAASAAAALVPGFGPKDIEYPKIFEGRWLTKQTFTSINITNEMKTIPRIITGLIYLQSINPQPTISYSRSYINYQNNVILDRAKESADLYKIILPKQPLYVSASWSPFNTNVISITTADNIIEEIKVTKRSVEDLSASNSLQIGYSEYSRITEADSSGFQNLQSDYMVPKFFSKRLLARYRYEPKIDKIIGVERVYYYPGDSVDLGFQEPIAVIKSKLELSRSSS